MSIETSAEIDKIAAALVIAQGCIENVSLNKTNPHFKSKYADLAAIREACRVPLAQNSLAVIQSPATANGKVTLTTMLLHTSGQWLKSTLELKPERAESPQSVGSAITYARRYSLAAILGIVAEEDDDGNAASLNRTDGRNARAVADSSTPRPTNYRQKTFESKHSTPEKIIFNKDNPDFVAKVSQQVLPSYGQAAVDWIITRLHDKEVKQGIVNEYIDLWIKESLTQTVPAEFIDLWINEAEEEVPF